MTDPAPTTPKKRWSPIPTAIGLALLAGFVAWFALVGYHRHKVEITVNGKQVHFVSRRSPWEVALPDQRAPREYHWGAYGTGRGRAIGGDTGKPVVAADVILPVNIAGRGYLDTTQIINIMSPNYRLEFLINEVPFVVENDGVRSGDRRWPLPATGVLEINVDTLP